MRGAFSRQRSGTRSCHRPRRLDEVVVDGDEPAERHANLPIVCQVNSTARRCLLDPPRARRESPGAGAGARVRCGRTRRCRAGRSGCRARCGPRPRSPRPSTTVSQIHGAMSTARDRSASERPGRRYAVWSTSDVFDVDRQDLPQLDVAAVEREARVREQRVLVAEVLRHVTPLLARGDRGARRWSGSRSSSEGAARRRRTSSTPPYA